MSEGIKYLLHMLRFAFECDDMPQYNEEVDFEELYRICKKHHIEALFAYGLSKCSYSKSINKEIYDRFILKWKMTIMHDMNQEIFMNELFDSFEKNGVEYAPLKGIYLKKLYPRSELRTMTDLDILFNPEQVKIIDHIMVSLGYCCIESNTHQIVYTKKPSINVELHMNIVDDGSIFDEYYKDIFSRLDQKSKCRKEMNYNDFYIFHIAHMAKHFINAGCGLRFITDLYVLQKNISYDLNREYIEYELMKLGLLNFEQNVVRLTNSIFNGKDIEGIELEILLYILDSGIYGHVVNANANKASLEKTNVKIGKFKLFRDTIFQPLKVIRHNYTYVDKFPILLPIGWVHRWVKTLCRKGRTTSVLKTNLIDIDTLERRRALFYSVGFEKEYCE